MGCGTSKVSSGMSVDVPKKDKNGSHPTDKDENLFTERSAMNDKPSNLSEVSIIKDFKVNASDFVVEKKGRIQTEYTLLDPVLGKGAFGEVRRAVHKLSNITRAVKIIYKESTEKEEQDILMNEIAILKTLDHPNIMKIIEFFQDDRHFYIVSEYYTGGELFDRILKLKTFTEKKAAITMKQILSAVYYCHQHSIVHRDLKPENILYESNREDSLIKVIDFGTSKVFDPKAKMNKKYGTPYYIAPEVLRRKYTEKCDIWSCGVILYILLCGYPPFSANTDKAIMDKVLIGKYDFNHPVWDKVSDEAKKFVTHMMEVDVNLRYTAEQALNDHWIKKYTSANELDRPLAISALNNLKSYRAERKLQEATWVYLVSYLSNKEEKNALLKTFQALDTNGDGQLTRDELVDGYKKIMGSGEAEKEVQSIMEIVDSNNSGAIDYTEFVIATINRQTLLSKERLEAAFKMFDKDGNGYITVDELKEIFQPAQSKDAHNNKLWLELIKEVDANSDGRISFKEFKEMMLKLS